MTISVKNVLQIDRHFVLFSIIKHYIGLVILFALLCVAPHTSSRFYFIFLAVSLVYLDIRVCMHNFVFLYSKY